MRRKLVISILAFAALPLFGSVALAGPEWCDDGSPPPNDFRFRPTGTGSVGSSTLWLNSTTGGTLSFTGTTYTGTLQGGVAHGMQEALDHARPYTTLPRRP